MWNTLLELTLALEYTPAVKRNERKASTGHAPDTTSLVQAEEHVMAILTHQHAKYDPDHALVLVQAHGFKRGQLELYEKLEMYHMLLRHYMEASGSGGDGERVEHHRQVQSVGGQGSQLVDAGADALCAALHGVVVVVLLLRV